MKFTSIEHLRREAKSLRERLESSFTPETAFGGEKGNVASSGHCAAVAYIVFNKFGGSLVSATVQGDSHWFNKIHVGIKCFDLDITGDQFGRPSIQIGADGSLYDGERVRQLGNLREETIARASKLAKKAGIKLKVHNVDLDDQPCK
jgi:hypothetical protein